MTIVIETGAGTLASANSYYSLVSATTYITTIGRSSEWTSFSTTTQNAALIRACYFMETLDWNGTKTSSTNPLEWPRRNVLDRNGYYISATGIPLHIKWVQTELAIRFINDNDPLPDQDTSGNIVRERVDVVEIEYERGGASQIPSMPYIYVLLKPWIRSKNIVEIVRA